MHADPQTPGAPVCSAQEHITALVLDSRYRSSTKLHIQIFFLAFAFALVHGPGPGVGFGHGFETIAIARSLVHSGSFADPFGQPTGPTAHTGPIFPVFLALNFHIFGDGPGILWSLVLFSCAFLALEAVLVFRLASTHFRSLRAGYAAAVLAVVALPNQPNLESVYVACGMLAFVLTIDTARPLFSGGLAGLLALLSESSLAFTVPVLACQAVRRRNYRFLLSASLSLLASILPWTVRNSVALGYPVLIRDNLGLELYVANNDEVSRGASFIALHPAYNQAELEAVRRQGEVPYNASCMQAARRWIVNHPKNFARLTAMRIGAFWFPSTNYWACLVTALGIAGLFAESRSALRFVWLAAAIFYPVVYYFVQTDTQTYRYTVLWACIVPAAGLLDRTLAMLSRGRGFGPRKLGDLRKNWNCRTNA